MAEKETKSYAAEEAVVGAMLIDEATLPMLMDRLRPEDFADPALRHLFEAARTLWLEQKPVDPVTLGAAVGTEDYARFAREIMLNTPTAAHAEEYAAIVRDAARLRAMQAAAMRVLQADTTEEASAALSEAAALTLERRSRHRITIQDAIMEFYARLDKQRGKLTEYIDWGLDYMTHSLDTELGDFVVLGGYPSAGKTLLALQCALVIAKKYRVGFISFETNERKLTNRIMSASAGVPLWLIKHNVLSDGQLKMLTEAGEKIWPLRLTIEEAAGCSADDIRAITLAGRYQVIFVDYLQLVNEHGSNRYEVVTEISRKLHTMAQELGVLVVALAQLTRPEKSGKDGKPVMPGMSSIRESGQVEQDADAIMLLYKEDPTKKDSPRILRIAKNKESEIPDPARLELRGATQTFIEAELPHYPQPRGGKKKAAAAPDEQEELPL